MLFEWFMTNLGHKSLGELLFLKFRFLNMLFLLIIMNSNTIRSGQRLITPTINPRKPSNPSLNADFSRVVKFDSLDGVDVINSVNSRFKVKYFTLSSK